MIRYRDADLAHDSEAIARVLKAAFEQDDEADLVAGLREEGAMALERVAEDGGTVVGHIAFSRLVQPCGALALAPVAVDPKRHAQGIGGSLIRTGLERLGAMGAAAVIVLGEPDYYRRFGFRAESIAHLASPYPPAFMMGLDLEAGFLERASGRIVYPAAFG